MREELEARPALLLFIGFLLGLVATPFPLACVFIISFAFWVRMLPRKWLLVGSFVFGLILSPAMPQPLLEAKPVHGLGVVSAVPILTATTQRTEVSVNGNTLIATLPLNPPVMLGDEIRVSGIAKPVSSDFFRQASFDRVEGRIDLERVEVASSGSAFAHFADGWRRSFLSFAARSLTTRDANLIDAVCFNGRAMLDSGTREELGRSGLIHILSASGMQVFVFAFLVTLNLRPFPLHRRIVVLTLACVLSLYAIGAGLQPQIVRAVVMTIAGMSAYLFGREPDAVSALSLSGLAYLLWRPETVYSMSFQLSMIVVGSVALFFRRERASDDSDKAELIRLFKDFGRLSIIVLLATTPLVAYYLGVVSLQSAFANLMVCWSVPFLVAFAFSAYGVSLVLPSVGDAMANLVLTPLSHWIYGISGLMGSSWGVVQVPDFNGLWLVVIYGAWLMTYRRRVVQP